MSFPIIVILMLVAGLIGGFINYLLPANQSAETGKFIKPWWQCIVLGIGATRLVPLFLEIAQSKLLDDMYTAFSWQKPDQSGNNRRMDTLIIHNYVDTAKKIVHNDTVRPNQSSTQVSTSIKTAAQVKDYLLYFAYCLLAAAAGFRFINMLINNVVKDQQISQQKEKITGLEKAQEKRIKNSLLSQQQEAAKVSSDFTQANLLNIKQEINSEGTLNIPVPILPNLPPVTHPDDPQKGRFGGKPENNHRRLMATVSSSVFPEFYNVVIWVETTDPNLPLNTDVIFYLHDSFTPSVYMIKTNEFTDGKAMDNEILSYGAFTVGAITDNGNTLLELDLSEDKNFPREFRER